MSKGLARRKFSKGLKREAVKISDRKALTIPQSAEGGSPLSIARLIYPTPYSLPTRRRRSPARGEHA